MTASTCNIRNNYNRIDHYFVPLRKQRSSVERAKRCLFGPIDHNFNEKWIEEQLRKQIIQDSFKYGIDFSDGKIVNLRGLKRPIDYYEQQQQDDDNLSQYYFQPIQSDDTPNKCEVVEEEKKKKKSLEQTLLTPISSSIAAATITPTISGPNIRKSVKQSLLTDFLQSKKPSNNSVGLLKKDQAEDRPNKMLKLADSSITNS